MKIGVISDIHVDINYKENDTIEDALIKVIQDMSIDVMIIAGDISNDYTKSIQVIDYIESKTGCKCLFVPGNHDLWNIHHEEIAHTDDIYNTFQAHDSCLCGKPYPLNEDYVVIGDIGWYDYSFGSDNYDHTVYEVGYHQERQWQDKNYIHWHMSDQEKTLELYDKLAKQIAQHQDKNIIFVTHMVTDSNFTVPLPNDTWEYFNAYLGSEQYGHLFKENVKHIIMGHVHYRFGLLKHNQEYSCRCLNYRTQWENEHETLKNIQDTMKIITI
ncbi:metallophosphoesterase [Vallitalea pronyensis]|uniref:Metallophosphoesterase n=1 Tax=Vallitalea pronyensis TaxID=1348613 RepID=A0A8J8SGD6_9FIRM|nr:metallophosphoesterase [Vallitalea pronyensis]QUI22198.1 metallophosphoesterase [Vallitalea pronyensis]